MRSGSLGSTRNKMVFGEALLLAAVVLTFIVGVPIGDLPYLTLGVIGTALLVLGALAIRWTDRHGTW